MPESLRAVLGGVPLSDALTRQLGLPRNTDVSFLGADIWEAQPREVIHRAADEVIKVVRRRMGELESSSQQVVPDGIDLEQLDVTTRARNGLVRIRMAERSGGLTAGELASVPAIGAMTLLDIATATAHAAGPPAAGDAPPRGSRPSKAVAREARRISRRHWAARVGHQDPRLGAELRAIHSDAVTARDLPDLLAELPVTPIQARKIVDRLRRLDAAAEALRRLDLQEELEQFMSLLGRTPAGMTMLRTRFGLDSGAPATLEQAGRAAGVTRERVRQVEKRFHEAVREPPGAWTPALDRAVRDIAGALPTTSGQLEAQLHRDGAIPPTVPVTVVLRAAEAFGKPLDVRQDSHTGLMLSAEETTSPAAVAAEARKLVEHWGATTVDELSARLTADGAPVADADVIRLVVSSLDGFSWLDRQSGWFWLQNGRRNRLLNQIAKIMSIAEQIDLGELREGVGRHHRMHGFRPPREVLATLCVQSQLYTRLGDTIRGTEALPDWRELLGRNERTLAEILFEEGPVMRRDELERRAIVDRGLNRSSFYVYLGYSPILARYAPGVYGLRGAQVSAGEVQALIPPRVRSQVLQDHGWTAEGDIWIAYKMSASTVASGVLGVPGALRAVLKGPYELRAEGGDPVGTLTIRESMWGVSPFFRRRGVEAGDYIVLQIALSEKTATIVSGAEELLLRYQDAE